MNDADPPRGFVERTRVGDARETLRAETTVSTGTETVPLEDADGRVLAETLESPRNVPDFPRAAMDGYAVRAKDTFTAADRSPETLSAGDRPGPGTAAWVHTGSPVEEPADAVLKTENAREVGTSIEVTKAVAVGENVSDIGEDLEAGQHLFDSGKRLRPSDLALLRSVEVDSVTVWERPSVAVIPTGEELVDADPEPGEAIETNGLMVASLIERWGGAAERHEVITDDETALSEAISGATDADVIVTTGGSSIGKRDLLPAVVEDLGELLAHGVALKPGHPVAMGVVDGTPVLNLPGYPVACIVNAWQFVRPVLNWVAGTEPAEPARIRAELDRKIRSEPGVRSCVRVTVSGGDQPTAAPVHESGASILSSVSLADGWVQVPEPVEGHDAGETVTVEFWEAHP